MTISESRGTRRRTDPAPAKMTKDQIPAAVDAVTGLMQVLRHLGTAGKAEIYAPEYAADLRPGRTNCGRARRSSASSAGPNVDGYRAAVELRTLVLLSALHPARCASQRQISGAPPLMCSVWPIRNVLVKANSMP